MLLYKLIPIIWLAVMLRCSLSHETLDLCPQVSRMHETCIRSSESSQQIQSSAGASSRGLNTEGNGMDFEVIDGLLTTKIEGMEERIDAKLLQYRTMIRKGKRQILDKLEREFDEKMARLKEIELGVDWKLQKQRGSMEEERRAFSADCNHICREIINGIRASNPVGYATVGAEARIYPQYGDLDGVQVYCDCSDGADQAWTVFQRRMDGSVDFYRDWIQYQDGFGNPLGEFWLGLKYTSLMTAPPNTYELRIDLRSPPRRGGEEYAYAHYDTFRINNCSSQYALTATEYTGTAGDSLEKHNGHWFATKDNDKLNGWFPCALNHRGAWWFNDEHCFQAHLNGQYYRQGVRTDYGKGIVWKDFAGKWVSLIQSEMKFRRRR